MHHGLKIQWRCLCADYLIRSITYFCFIYSFLCICDIAQHRELVVFSLCVALQKSDVDDDDDDDD